MIKFIKNIDTEIAIGNLIYNETDNSFNFEPQPLGGVASILINDIQIEIDETGNVKYVWGLCPKSNWLQTNANPPIFTRSSLKAVLQEIIPGTSKRINNNERWPVFFNKDDCWIFVGHDVFRQTTNHIEFAQNCVAIISSADTLSGLWLHPKMLS